jgi:hypothetical protein
MPGYILFPVGKWRVKCDEVPIYSLRNRDLIKHPDWLVIPPTLLFIWYQLLLWDFCTHQHNYSRTHPATYSVGTSGLLETSHLQSIQTGSGTHPVPYAVGASGSLETFLFFNAASSQGLTLHHKTWSSARLQNDWRALIHMPSWRGI